MCVCVCAKNFIRRKERKITEIVLTTDVQPTLDAARILQFHRGSLRPNTNCRKYIAQVHLSHKKTNRVARSQDVLSLLKIIRDTHSLVRGQSFDASRDKPTYFFFLFLFSSSTRQNDTRNCERSKSRGNVAANASIHALSGVARANCRHDPRTPANKSELTQQTLSRPR